MYIEFQSNDFYSGQDLLDYHIDNGTISKDTTNPDDVADEKGSKGLWDLSHTIMDYLNRNDIDEDTKQSELYYLLQDITRGE